MSERKVRVRFAPSPTGPLHIGGVRTALYNYLFARQHGGELVFRIEDTDSHRFVQGAEDYIIESFKWLGIKFDEGVSFGGDHGPYRQSERRKIYKKYVKQLLDDGKAYIAFDTPEELEKKREEVKNFQYDAHTRMSMRNSLTLSKEEVAQLLDSDAQYTVRFKVEPGEEIHVNDLIRGDVCVKSDILDDKDNPCHTWRGVAAERAASRAALQGVWLGRHHASLRPPAVAAQAGGQGQAVEARRRPTRLPGLPARMARPQDG